MGSITRHEGGEEFFAEFIQVDGHRGSVLIFPNEKGDEGDLAKEIATLLDCPEEE